MLRKQRLIWEKAGTVYFDVPEGRPSAATVTIKTATNGDLPDAAVEDEDATIDAVNTTIAAGWNADDPRIIPLASTANIDVDRDYMIVAIGGRSTWATVTGFVGSPSQSTEVETVFEPEFDLAEGDAFVGTRLSYAITAANAANRAHNYRCVWEYTMGGVEYVAETLFDIVRTPPKNPATVTGLKAEHPELINQWEQLLDSAYDLQDRLDMAFDRVIVAMESAAPSDNSWADAIVQWSQCERAVYERLLLDLAMAGFIPPAYSDQGDIWYDMREKEYSRSIEEWTKKIVWYDVDDDRVQGDGEEGRNQWSITLKG